MRHPVSSCNRAVDCLGGVVQLWVVGLAVHPCSPEDAYPSAGEDANGVGMVAAPGSRLLVDVSGPWRCVARIICETSDGSPQAVVAGPAKDDAPAFPRGMGDRTDACFGGELVSGWEARTDIAEFGENLGSADASRPWEGHDDPTVWHFCDGVLDACRELGDLADKAFQEPGKGADHLALGLGFGLTGQAGGGGAQAGQQFGWSAAARVGLACQKGAETLLAKTASGFRCRVALNESQRDRRGDVSKDGGRARPEALQQAAQTVRQHHPLGHQVVATPDQGAQGFDLVGTGLQRAEAMAIGAQDVRQHVGVAWIALTAGGTVARPA